MYRPFVDSTDDGYLHHTKVHLIDHDSQCGCENGRGTENVRRSDCDCGSGRDRESGRAVQRNARGGQLDQGSRIEPNNPTISRFSDDYDAFLCWNKRLFQRSDKIHYLCRRTEVKAIMFEKAGGNGFCE